MAGGLVAGLSARRKFYAFNDFVSAASNHEWAVTQAGTSAALTLAAAVAGTLGLAQFRLGTTATGRVTVMSVATDCILLGNGKARYAQRYRPLLLSTATDTYTTRLGFINSATAEPSNGCYFRYRHDLNGGRWQAVCRANNVETASAIDTGVAATANVWTLMEVRLNADASRATFLINDTEVASVTANIPTGSLRTAYGMSVIRSVGTADITVAQTDYAETEYLFTSPR
jgi:hypothetical protein